MHHRFGQIQQQVTPQHAQHRRRIPHVLRFYLGRGHDLATRMAASLGVVSLLVCEDPPLQLTRCGEGVRRVGSAFNLLGGGDAAGVAGAGGEGVMGDLEGVDEGRGGDGGAPSSGSGGGSGTGVGGSGGLAVADVIAVVGTTAGNAIMTIMTIMAIMAIMTIMTIMAVMTVMTVVAVVAVGEQVHHPIQCGDGTGDNHFFVSDHHRRS